MWFCSRQAVATLPVPGSALPRGESVNTGAQPTALASHQVEPISPNGVTQKRSRCPGMRATAATTSPRP